MNCRYCNGTGHRPEVAHVDGGRCWHCNGVDTSYTRRLEAMSDDEIAAEVAAGMTQRKDERQARRAARTSS